MTSTSVEPRVAEGAIVIWAVRSVQELTVTDATVIPGSRNSTLAPDWKFEQTHRDARQRRVLEQADDLADLRRDHVAECLWKHDVAGLTGG